MLAITSWSEVGLYPTPAQENYSPWLASSLEITCMVWNFQEECTFHDWIVFSQVGKWGRPLCHSLSWAPQPPPGSAALPHLPHVVWVTAVLIKIKPRVGTLIFHRNTKWIGFSIMLDYNESSRKWVQHELIPSAPADRWIETFQFVSSLLSSEHFWHFLQETGGCDLRFP